VKHIDSPVAVDADILQVQDLEAGNMLAKELTYLADTDAAGIELGGSGTNRPGQPGGQPPGAAGQLFRRSTLQALRAHAVYLSLRREPVLYLLSGAGRPA
jgi:hypothetical protein